MLLERERESLLGGVCDLCLVLHLPKTSVASLGFYMCGVE